MRLLSEGTARKRFKHLVKTYAQSNTVNRIAFTDYLLLSDSISKADRYGEARSAPTHPGELLDRLFTHLQLVMCIVATKHLDQFKVKSSKQLKDIDHNYRYKVSRLLTPEFSFYTPRALESDEFQCLQQKLLNHAKTLPVNVHCLLSSFAVNYADKLHNVCLYIICGPEASFHVFHKAHGIPYDERYEDERIPFAQVAKGHEREVGLSSAFIAMTSGTLISNLSVFPVRVYDQWYWQCIEICFDHKRNHAGNLLKHFILTSQANMPQKVSHVLTSNVIGIQAAEIVSFEQIRHVDPQYSDTAYNLTLPVSTCSSPVFGPTVSLYRLDEVSVDTPTPLELEMQQAQVMNLAKRYGLNINQTFVDLHLSYFLAENHWEAVNLLLHYATYVSPANFAILRKNSSLVDFRHLDSLTQGQTLALRPNRFSGDLRLEGIRRLIQSRQSHRRETMASLKEPFLQETDIWHQYATIILQSFKPQVPDLNRLANNVQHLESRHVDVLARHAASITSDKGLASIAKQAYQLSEDGCQALFSQRRRFFSTDNGASVALVTQMARFYCGS